MDMVASEVTEYVRVQLAAGYSEGEVWDALRSQGWSDQEISEAVQLAQAQLQVVPPVVIKKHKNLSFVISLIAGLILFINSLEIVLALPLISSYLSQAGITMNMFGFIQGFLGSDLNGGILLLIFSVLVILGSLLIRKQGKEGIGAMLVVIFSLLSLIGFSGFLLFIGAVIGIIGGILGIVRWKRNR